MSILLKPALPVGRTSLLFGIQQSRMVVWATSDIVSKAT
jgi:hypothetical protein